MHAMQGRHCDWLANLEVITVLDGHKWNGMETEYGMDWGLTRHYTPLLLRLTI